MQMQMGQEFTKIAEALEAAHHFADMEIVIHIAPGTYKECLVINQEHISFIGTDENETKITYSYGALDIMPEGDKRGTFRTPSVFIDADHFYACHISFFNEAGVDFKVGQALAMYADGDRFVFENCRFDHCTFYKSNFIDLQFSHCDLSNSNFTESYFNRCRYDDVKAIGANFSQITANHLFFAACNLKYVNFDESKLSFIHFGQTTLEQGNLQSCKLKSVAFDECTLNGVNCFKTTLKGLDLTTCLIDGLSVSDDFRELKGVKVNALQAVELAKLLGVVVKQRYLEKRNLNLSLKL